MKQSAIAPSTDVEMSKAMRSKKEIWNLEQEIVASLVQVDGDPPVDNSVIGDNPLFQLIRDDYKDVFSFSSQPELYGGVDVSFPPTDDDLAVAVYVIIDKRSMTVVYHDHEYFSLEIPYIPCYLAFREIRPLELLVQRQVQRRPDLTPLAILVDGNGILHPRHAGIACFLGTRTNIPTVGIGKSLLYEGGWTRDNISNSLDIFLRELRDVIDQNPQTLAPQLSRYRGMILRKKGESDPTNSGVSGASSSSSSDLMDNGNGTIVETSVIPIDHRKFDGHWQNDGDGRHGGAAEGDTAKRTQILQDLAPFCNGIAIPLKGTHDDQRFPVLGCAIVGHGGQIAARGRSQPFSGSSKPIYVSVGHRLSLPKAAQIAASLSLGRIPEPVRQADLYGRELLRRRAKQQHESQQRLA
jgi:deoxyinosine 3'endonuclease (endonuclease V)